MLNRFPLWKYLMVVSVLLISALYALPNLYGEDPAVQITGSRGTEVQTSTLDVVAENLKNNDIAYKSIAF